MFKKLIAGALLATLALSAFAPVASAHHTSGGKNIAQRVKHISYFDTLYAAAACTPSVADTLTNEDLRLTLFGPTDRAFRKLGRALIDTPITARNICELDFDAVLEVDAALEKILLYHVIDPAANLGRVTYREAVKLSPTHVPMALGETAKLKGSWFTLRLATANPLGTSRVVRANIWANNGIIHAVDDVLVPTFS
jgi:transforming growth factor-beta-induced protein